MYTYYVAGIPYSDELYHHGIKGQKWGIRRFQNPDGTLTEEGKRRYSDSYATGGYDPYVKGKKQKMNADAKLDIIRERVRDKFWDGGYDWNAGKEKLRKRGYDPSVFDEIYKTAFKTSGSVKRSQEYLNASERRNRNLNPFKAKQLLADVQKSMKNLQEANRFGEKLLINMSWDMINKMPNDLREDAMLYVYSKLDEAW